MPGYDRKIVKHIHEGRLAATVEITLHSGGDIDWSPTIGPDDIAKPDRAIWALKAGDIAAAAKEAKVFELLPLAGE